MRVLIDECLNWRLGRALTGHFCVSVQRMGWKESETANCSHGWSRKGSTVFITGDRNLQFQQHLPAAGVAVVVLAARSTRLAETMPLMAEVLAQLPTLRPGTATFIPAS